MACRPNLLLNLLSRALNAGFLEPFQRGSASTAKASLAFYQIGLAPFFSSVALQYYYVSFFLKTWDFQFSVFREAIGKA